MRDNSESKMSLPESKQSADRNIDNESEDLMSKKCLGIGYDLFHYMKKFENNIAQFNYESDTSDTYKTQLEKCIRTALKLRSKIFDQNPIIGISARNHSNSTVPFISALFLGYRTVTIDGSLSSKDASALIKQVTPTILFVDEEFVEMMEDAIIKSGKNFELVVFGKYGNYPTFDEYLKPCENEEKFEPVQLEDPNQTAVILFSSGSTGLSKGICLSHKGLLFQGYCYSKLQNISAESVLLYFTSLTWISAVVLLISATTTGASRVNSAITNTWEAIDKYKVTNLFMSPYIASVLMSQEKSSGLNTESVKTLMTAGTKLNPVLMSKLKNAFPKTLVTQSYGQTEGSGWLIMFQYRKKEDHLLASKKPDSVGRPILGLSAKIVDRETEEELGSHKVGELRLRADFFMNGFFNQDSSKEFDEQGWFKTGDLFYYDEDHCFFVAGRCKEMLKFRGFQIQPLMLEQILESNPAVYKAVVLAITHEIDGDHPVGIVTLNKGYENTTAKELELFVEGQVQDRQRLRGGVKIIKEIPYTVTGKPQRFLLKQWLDEGKI